MDDSVLESVHDTGVEPKGHHTHRVHRVIYFSISIGTKADRLEVQVLALEKCVAELETLLSQHADGGLSSKPLERALRKIHSLHTTNRDPEINPLISKTTRFAGPVLGADDCEILRKWM